jgi:hypothetical protein
MKHAKVSNETKYFQQQLQATEIVKFDALAVNLCASAYEKVKIS